MRIHPRLVIGVSIAVALALTPAAASAVTDIGVTAGSDAAAYDVRRTVDGVRPTESQLAAVSRLVGAAGAGTRLTWDGRFGTPRTIRMHGGWLTGPTSGNAIDVARSFLQANRTAFGLSAEDVAALTVVRDHELVGTGTHVVGFTQTFAGLPRSARRSSGRCGSA